MARSYRSDRRPADAGVRQCAPAFAVPQVIHVVAGPSFAVSGHTAAASMGCVEVRDVATFRSLASAWNAAAEASASPSVFLRHEWFDAAWSWRQATADLALVVLRADRAGLCALPLVRTHSDHRRLELLTIPDTQFADMVAPASGAGAAATAFAAALRSRRDWDVLHLDYLRDNAAVVAHLVPALEAAGLPAHVADRGTNPFIEIGRAWSDYFGTRSRRLKKALNLAANRLHKVGEVSIEHITADADDATFRRALEATIEVSASSWKQHTGNSLDQPGPQAFVRALSVAARRQGWLSMWLLRLDGKPLAMEYQLVHGDAVHALRADFLAECEEISPGTHLFRVLLERLCDRGYARYYLGPGDNAYKSRWSESGAAMRRVIVYNRTARGRIRRMVEEFAKPALRRLRDHLPARSPAAARQHSASDDGPTAAEPRAPTRAGREQAAGSARS